MFTEFKTGKATHGIYPWNVQSKRLHETSSDIYYGCDDDVRIAMCLGCTKTRCVNCLGRKMSTVRTDRECRIRERVKELLNQKKSKQEICEAAGISDATFYRYRRKIVKMETEAVMA